MNSLKVYLNGINYNATKKIPKMQLSEQSSNVTI